jgi:hypothetical protein
MENMFFSLEKLRPGHAKVLAGMRVRGRARVPRQCGRARVWTVEIFGSSPFCLIRCGKNCSSLISTSRLRAFA